MRRVFTSSILLVILIGSIATSLYLLAEPTPQAFTLSTYPSDLKGDAIAGQRIVILVTVAENSSGPSAGVVKLSVSAPLSSISLEPQMLAPGQVGEVTVIPAVDAVGSNVTVTVSGERDGLVQHQALKFAVIRGEDDRGDHARELRDIFTQWLQVNRPELGINNQTAWLGTMVSPRWLVVSHYLFFSNEWEMHVYWHVMIPPYDWARIDLRHRSTDLAPSFSFEISSLNASLPPHQITPPTSAWR